MPRVYGEPAGIRLLVALEAAGFDLFTSSQAIQVAASLGLGRGHTHKLLHQLALGGWLTRVKKGLYAVTDPVTRLPRAHPFAIGTAILVPSAVSHWSALQQWGLTEQIPTTITITSPERSFISVHRHEERIKLTDFVVEGTQYQFVAVTPDRFFGVTEVWINDRNRVPLFDAERALLDTFHHFHIFGSLSIGLQILEAHVNEIDQARLVDYARQLGITAVVKRLGWALERFGASPMVTASLRAFPAKGDSPLDPGRPARGHHNRVWNVIENLADVQ